MRDKNARSGPDNRVAGHTIATQDQALADIRQKKWGFIGSNLTTAAGCTAVAAAIAAVPVASALPVASFIDGTSLLEIPVGVAWMGAAAVALPMSFGLLRGAAAHARVAIRTAFLRPESAIAKWYGESDRADRAASRLSDKEAFLQYEKSAESAGPISKHIICANEMLAIAKRSDDPIHRAELITRIFRCAPHITDTGVMRRAGAQLLADLPSWASSPDDNVRADCVKQLEHVAGTVASCSAELREKTASFLFETGSGLVSEAPELAHRLYRKALEIAPSSMSLTRHTTEEGLLGLLKDSSLPARTKLDIAVDVLKFGTGYRETREELSRHIEGLTGELDAVERSRANRVSFHCSKIGYALLRLGHVAATYAGGGR